MKRNKKAMDTQFSQVLTIFLAVAIFTILFIALFPKIKNLPQEGLAALGLVDDKCKHSGLTKEDYSERITQALYNEQVSSAISYFREFRDKCEFKVNDLSIGGGQGREKSILLADSLCERGYFIDARDIYNAIPSEDKGDIAETCINLAEINVLISRGKILEAKSLLEGITIPEDSPNKWKASIADIYIELEDYSKAYDTYYSIYESYEDNNPLTNFLSKATVLTKLNLINHIILIQKFETSTLPFCFKIPEYPSTISSTTLTNYAQTKGITLDINTFEYSQNIKGFNCVKSETTWICTPYETCNKEIIELLN